MPDLTISAPDGKTYKMPWSQDRDPTEQEIDKFISSQSSTESKVVNSSPFLKEVQKSAETGRTMSPFSMFESFLPEHNRNYTPETLPSFPVRAAKEILYEGMIRPALSPAGIATSLVSTGGAIFPKTRQIAGSLARKYAPNISRAILGDEIPSTLPILGGAEVQNARVNPQTGEIIIPGHSKGMNLPKEFTPVGAEPPYTPPAFPNPEESVYQKVLQQGGRQAPLKTTEVVNSAVVKAASDAKPKLRINQADLSKVDLINPSQETLEVMGRRGYSPHSVNPDGSLRMETSSNLVTKPSEVKQVPMLGSEPLLPRELKGAQPRFNIGQKSYTPNFASDLDKAAYILAQASPSKRNADYLKFVMDNTGLDANDAIAYGQKVKAAVKDALRGQPEGTVIIPKIGHEIQPITNPVASDSVIPKFGQKLPKGTPPFKAGEPIPVQSVQPPPPIKPVDLAEPGGVPKPPKKETLGNKLLNIAGTPKSLMTGFDLSAPLRQGRVLANKKEFWTSLKPMIQAAKSDKNFNAIQDSIKAKPTFDLGQKSGLSLTDLGNNLSDREEAIMSNLPEKIPGYKASNRAYTAFLNKLRADTFESLVNDAKTAGHNIDDVEFTKQIAKFVNNATGRGSLGEFEGAAKALNTVFFSPRFVSSRISLLNPYNYTKMDPFVRKEALKSMLTLAGSQTTILGLAAMAGAKVSIDPTNADFGKIRVGNTRLDTNAGFQQYIKMFSQLYQGKITSSTTGKSTDLTKPGFGKPTRMDVVAGAIETRESPIASFVTEMLKGKDIGGNKTDINKAIVTRVTPMIMQDLYEIYKEDPKLLPMGLPAIFGASVQTYGKKPVPKSPLSVERIQ